MYQKSVKVSLVLVYLVIIAGAMVRMTGSGMGCPDWPKCFGYYIPPTTIEELQWQPDRNFKKGHVIIKDETLQVAAKDFTTGDTFNPSDWELYTKHDYAIFNVWHTWIEYVNRLFGALSGLAILVMAVFSIKKWKVDKKITLLSIFSVFLLGFQAWLGATVVYSVLAPAKITIHMIMALVIVALLLYLLKLSEEKTTPHPTTKTFNILLIIALALTIIQVILGTQVRQFVDQQIDLLGYNAAASWLDNPTAVFYFHRSFSILIVVLNLYLWYVNKKQNFQIKHLSLLLYLILAEAFTGVLMYYFDFPLLSQPLHLILAALLFGIQFYIVLEAFQKKKTFKSL